MLWSEDPSETKKKKRRKKKKKTWAEINSKFCLHVSGLYSGSELRICFLYRCVKAFWRTTQFRAAKWSNKHLSIQTHYRKHSACVNPHAWSSPAPLPCPHCRRVWCLFGCVKNSPALFCLRLWEGGIPRWERSFNRHVWWASLTPSCPRNKDGLQTHTELH